MSEVTYHRQIDGGPVIVVKNGFLDERCGPEESHAVGVQRSKSAPTPFTAEMQTEDAESSCRDRGLSGDASTSFAGSEQRSPYIGFSPSGPSCLLQSAVRQVPQRTAEERVDGLADFKLDDAAVHFDLIGLDEPEGDANGRRYVEDCEQHVSPLPPRPTPASPVLQPLNAQLLQLLTAQAQAAQVMNAVSAQQFWQLQMQPSMQSRPSSVQPSMHSSPQISPQLAPQLGHHVPQLLLSPLMPPGPEPSLPPSPDSSRPQSPQPVNPCPVGRQAPQPHTIRHSLNMETGMHQVFWHVDGSKLKGQERQTVSPSFELPFEGQVSFRLVLVPKPNPDGKGGASFKKANGVGSVHLKCEAAKGLVNFFVSISNGRPDFKREPRGPVKHNFAELSTCGLRKGDEMWDFTKAVDKETQTFAVCLEIASLGT
ncbi:Uncharacterized protein SCF082_LOCUS5590 [Durusdinium trenchii]|uniref:Uncharacterized protein n=1 Tax=Durusdinium trenchii TaxID=1381693 RepID=A0ABP0I8N0_9DINO